MPPRRVLAALALVATAAVAAATVVVHADVDRLARTCDVAVDGTVRARSVELDAAAGAIWTHYDVRVAETLWGNAATELRVSVPGGTVGALTQEVSGTPQLAEGERAVLFLWRDGPRLQVLGQSQGCFRVVATDDGPVCRNELRGLALVGEGGRRVAAQRIVTPLDALRARVAEIAAERRAEIARRRAALERRLAVLRERALRRADETRGKPGGAE